MEHKKTLQISNVFLNQRPSSACAEPVSVLIIKINPMKTLVKISRRLNALTQQDLMRGKKIEDFQSYYSGIWKGTKRYAH
ncbi:hypothetical protein [Algibacter luteus]|uniref:hypothetical protein n=1 Tax=Algibacter luteus TaxID=1178825 RepID=UPI00259296FC|nr:hypothetical protein [Algibacter luteus]WJJ95395.1 hypothetical protein O5O44_09195 [Algibacter luteus]